MNEATISKILKELGISPALLGYGFLKEAIMLAADQESFVHNLTKELYPEIARRHGSTPFRVERNIRHAIEAAWQWSYAGAQMHMFGSAIYAHKGKPTNGQFIATVVEYLKNTAKEEADG